MNGLGYDEWANKMRRHPLPPAAGRRRRRGGRPRPRATTPTSGTAPTYVPQVAAAVTAELTRSAPAPAAYFDERAAAWTTALQPYVDEVAAVKAVATGKTYAATESVFDDMAAAVGLVDLTPEGYRAAAANESDPAPADVNAFEELLAAAPSTCCREHPDRGLRCPTQLRSVAETAGVPVVEVTETVPPGETSFVTWQVDQLTALRAALGG